MTDDDREELFGPAVRGQLSLVKVILSSPASSLPPEKVRLREQLVNKLMDEMDICEDDRKKVSGFLYQIDDRQLKTGYSQGPV